jgi:transcriptional regulator with XRE-family HTH domain
MSQSYAGQNLKYLRKLKGLTQEEFANKLQIKRSLLGAYEEERAEPRIDVLEIISDQFGISLDELLRRDLSESNVSYLSRRRQQKLGAENNQIHFVPMKAAAGYLAGYADEEFIDELNRVPEYAKARADYAAQSVPIDRMRVTQELQRALTEPVTEGATRAGMFARAAEDAPKTIKKATGQQFFERLEDILEPSEMKVVNDIRDEFRRTKLADEQAKLGRAAAPEVDELASARIASSMNIPFLNRAWTIANTVIKRSLGRIDEKLATEIGMMMQDPAELSKAITKAKQYEARTAEIAERAKGRRQG